MRRDLIGLATWLKTTLVMLGAVGRRKDLRDPGETYWTEPSHLPESRADLGVAHSPSFTQHVAWRLRRTYVAPLRAPTTKAVLWTAAVELNEGRCRPGSTSIARGEWFK